MRQKIREEGYLEAIWVSGITGPTQNSNVFEKGDASLVPGNVDDDLEDTAESLDEFDGMVGL